MKFKTEKDKTVFEALEMNEKVIRKKLQLVKKSIDRKKSRDMKNNWRRNKQKFIKGLKKWHQSTQGKRFHRALGRFNALRENYNSLDTITDALFGLNSIETHLILELKYYEPDIEALSQFLEIFENFNEDTRELNQELKEAYISGKIETETINKLKELFEFFVDPKIYYYSIRELNGLTNNEYEMNEEEKLIFKKELAQIQEAYWNNDMERILENYKGF
jgi:hypothetical protein